MEERKQEVMEIIVKPTNDYWLEVTNEVNEWLYEALDDPYHLSYKIRKDKSSGGPNKVDLRHEPVWYYSNDGGNNWHAVISWDQSVEFKDMRVDVDWNVVKKKVVALNWSVARWQDFKKYNLVSMDWIIELDNWKFLINSYWKYQPNLSFINSVPEVKFEDEDKETFNLPEWSFSVVYWDFFISKKWTKCFRILPKEKAKHILICDDWGWAFNKYGWRTLPEEWSLYYRRASSNGWWMGNDYGVYPIDWKYSLSEEDI